MPNRRLTGLLLAASFLAALAGVLCGRLMSGDEPPSAATVRKSRQAYMESNSPPTVQEKLAAARREAARDPGLGAELGVTGVASYDLEDITGYLPRAPEARLALARLQNARMAYSLSSLGDPPLLDDFDVRKEIHEKYPTFTWNVRFQKRCGSCWAFAAVAAYEGNYLSKGDFGFEVDPSEQDILNCTLNADCRGGLIDLAFKVMASQGVANRGDVDYIAQKDVCRRDVARPFHVAEWGFVDDQYVDTDKIDQVDKLKRAILKYGAIGVAMYATPQFQLFKGPIWTANQRGQPNHAVAIVGWNKNKAGGAWLVKNSWGTSWGGNGDPDSGPGYLWVKYGSNRIGYDACWVKATGLPITPPPPEKPPPPLVPFAGGTSFQVFINDKLLDYKDTLIVAQNLGKDAGKFRVSLLDGKSKPKDYTLNGYAGQTLSVSQEYPEAASCTATVDPLENAAIRITAFWKQTNGALTVVPVTQGSASPQQPPPSTKKTSRTEEVEKRISTWEN